MLIQKLKNIVVCGVIALSSITLFSGCDTSKEPVNEDIAVTTATEETLSDEELDKMVENMPDIVFVMYHYYPLEREYKTGNFIGTSGYYIEKTGEIKYFEFEDEEAPKILGENDGTFIKIDINEYSEYRKIDEFNKKIKEHSFDTELNPVPKEDLIGYYKSLLKINTKEKLEYESSNITAVIGLHCIYGIISENNEEKYILIHEDGDLYYVNDNRYAQDLYNKLLSVFP